MRTLRRADLVDVARGAALFGSGGGGSPRDGMRMAAAFPEERTVELVTVEEVRGARTAVAAALGAPSSGATLERPDATLRAVEALDRLCRAELGEGIGYIVPAELASVVTTVAVLAAGHLGLPLVDADGAGRAVPLLPMVTFARAGTEPVVLANARGESAVLRMHGFDAVEALARAIVSEPAFGMPAGLALWPMTPETLAEVTPLRGTVTLCQEVGKVLREGGGLAAVLEKSGGRIAASGRIVSKTIAAQGGFDAGEVTIEEDGGRRVTLHVRNETMALWRGGIEEIAFPDLLSYVTEEGEPFTNADLDAHAGKRIHVVTMPGGGGHGAIADYLRAVYARER